MGDYDRRDKDRRDQHKTIDSRRERPPPPPPNRNAGPPMPRHTPYMPLQPPIIQQPNPGGRTIWTGKMCKSQACEEFEVYFKFIAGEKEVTKLPLPGDADLRL